MARRRRTAPAGPPQTYRQEFDSMEQLLAACKRSDVETYATAQPEFTMCSSLAQADELAHNGWTDELPAALAIADEAIAKVETDHTMTQFVSAYDVCGSDVDVSRFLSGEPENMIDYPMGPVVKAGKVITLCASVSVSGAVSAKAMVRRGQIVTALALALARLGYALEVYVDLHGQSSATANRSVTRTLVKTASDIIDPARLMFALAHPAMLRVFYFAALANFPSGTGVDGLMQRPLNPVEDLPDGTLYMPCLSSDQDVPNADEAVRDYLRQLEILD